MKLIFIGIAAVVVLVFFFSYFENWPISVSTGEWPAGKDDSGDLSPRPDGSQPPVGIAGDAAPASSPTDAELPSVRVILSRAVPRKRYLEVRGRTETAQRVAVRAETGGRIVSIAAKKGDFVRAGDPLCQIEAGAREASIRQARAALEREEFSYRSTMTLRASGTVSEARERERHASVEAARALLEIARLDLARTLIRAPIEGYLGPTVAEMGTTLNIGGVCATLISLDPLRAVSQVSERDVDRLSVGQNGEMTLISGQSYPGKISFIARSADPDTRTFRIEFSVPNPQHELRAGVTATLRLELTEGSAHQLPQSVLTLSDAGVLGIKVIDADSRAIFQPVEIISDTPEGVWLRGPEPSARVVTVGGEYVISGAKVRVVEQNP